MKSLFYKLCRLSCYLIVLLAVSCKKESSQDEQNEQLYTLNFQLSGFSSTKNPLKHAIGPINKLASTSGNTQQDSDGYLFFWSFNQDNLLPDIQVPSAEQTKITYNEGLTPNNYVNSTYSYDGYIGGRALTITGASELIIEMPLIHIQQLSTLGFDIGSSGTGPKDFELYYSFDGISYEPLQLVNQFNSATNNAKNSFTYNLHDLPLSGERLWIRLDLKAGDRMGGSDYNPTTGVFRIDNFHLKGTYELGQSADIAKLHYFIYHQDKPDIYAVGEIDESDLGDFQLQLPLGGYDVFFALNQSAMDLLLPNNKEDWTTLFVSNYFANAQAEIFGLVDEIEVTQNESYAFTLSRMYSQIKFEFTDTDLTLVDKLVITPLHDPHFFDPSGQVQTNPVLDQTEFVINGDIDANKQVVFNQFLGLLSDPKGISYQLDVYSDDVLIRSFSVASTLKNNMQLVFRGELLKDVAVSNNFTITKNETWGDTVEESF